ncbi:dihydrofolate reductase family protein [Draconibacterium sp.]|uniref:dihydrofolate reductase family protein n=1 Tax=Draconibacterium sp. TaxID=1965318 RepID=UPI00356455E8
MKQNFIFIAKSLDGYIADKDGGIDWLYSVPNPEGKDLGYLPFMKTIDALLMGRKTFEKVLSFDIPWPYEKPVFVASQTLSALPENLMGKVEIVKGTVAEMLNTIHKKGYHKLYIDGGNLIQSFLGEDRIDEMIISTLPLLLGDGFPLFGTLPQMLEFQHIKSELFLDAITQDTYRRKR